MKKNPQGFSQESSEFALFPCGRWSLVDMELIYEPIILYGWIVFFFNIRFPVHTFQTCASLHYLLFVLFKKWVCLSMEIDPMHQYMFVLRHLAVCKHIVLRQFCLHVHNKNRKVMRLIAKLIQKLVLILLQKYPAMHCIAHLYSHRLSACVSVHGKSIGCTLHNSMSAPFSIATCIIYASFVFFSFFQCNFI